MTEKATTTDWRTYATEEAQQEFADAQARLDDGEGTHESLVVLTHDERQLLAAVNRWALANGWKPAYRRHVRSHWIGPDGSGITVGSWLLLYDPDAVSMGNPRSRVHVSSVRQAVDVLVALGVLPAEFHSLTRALPAALDSARRVLAFHSRDWSEHGGDAWLYGLLLGWGGPDDPDDVDAWQEMADRHGWDAAELARLQRLHGALAPLGSEA